MHLLYIVCLNVCAYTKSIELAVRYSLSIFAGVNRGNEEFPHHHRPPDPLSFPPVLPRQRGSPLSDPLEGNHASSPREPDRELRLGAHPHAHHFCDLIGQQAVPDGQDPEREERRGLDEGMVHVELNRKEVYLRASSERRSNEISLEESQS